MFGPFLSRSIVACSWVCVCGCVGGWVVVYVCMCVWVYVCVCVRQFDYAYVFMCVCLRQTISCSLLIVVLPWIIKRTKPTKIILRKQLYRKKNCRVIFKQNKQNKDESNFWVNYLLKKATSNNFMDIVGNAFRYVKSKEIKIRNY